MAKLTRQQIYDQIRATSKEEYILTEMKRLGFWDATEGKPKVSEELIEKKGKLRRELNELVEKQRKFQDKERLLKEMRQKRMKEALERRAETKARRKKEREERAARWAELKARDIIYLGKGYSSTLNKKDVNSSKLNELGLPVFPNVDELAKAMKLTIGKLRFLSFQRTTSKTTHYKRFYLPKKSGGKRLISAPMPQLKNAQYWILENILYKLNTHDAAHGFVPKRSIISNAEKHCEKEVVINVDMKDFFPSVSYKRVRGLFKHFGYSDQIATILALLCTEPEVDEVALDGQRYFVAKGERFLPQGAPTSPAITNIICKRLDSRFAGMAKSLGWEYSRYADDITFSSNKTQDINRVLWQTKAIIEDEGFVLHPQKVKVMRKGSQQEVTGLTVNKKVNIPRKKLKQFRAVLHQIDKNGIEGVEWGNGFILLTIQGYANFINMVNPEKGAKFKKKVAKILAKPANKAAMQAYFNQPKAEKVAAPEAKASQKMETTTLDTAVSAETPDEKLQWWQLW